MCVYMKTANAERSNHSLAGLKAGGSYYEYQRCHRGFLCKTSHRSGPYFHFAFANQLTSVGSGWLHLAPSEFAQQKGRKPCL